MNFTEKLIRELKPDETKNWFEITDAKCSYLHCRIGQTGCKSYMLVKKIDGRCVRITIGKASEISVEFARKKAFELLEKIKNGVNPNNEKQQLCKETTFGELFEEYIERHAKRHASSGHLKNTLNIGKRRFIRWKNRKISSLCMREIEQWFYAIRDSNGIFAANQALILLRHIYNKAIQWGGTDAIRPPESKSFMLKLATVSFLLMKSNGFFRRWTQKPIRFTEHSFIH